MDRQAPPTWFWVVSVLGFLWNLAGVAAFVSQMTMDLSVLPDEQRRFYEATPIWATLAFAIAVFGGTLGCLALLFRKGWARTMLIISLTGIAVQICHSLIIGGGLEVFGSRGLILPVLTFAIGMLLVWFAKKSASKNWIV